jgi:hypothetical protein
MLRRHLDDLRPARLEEDVAAGQHLQVVALAADLLFPFDRPVGRDDGEPLLVVIPGDETARRARLVGRFGTNGRREERTETDQDGD